MGTVAVGNNLPLGAQLFDKDAGKFVRVRLFDSTDTELGVSPVSLSHVSDGFYASAAVPMPDVAAVHAVYEAFDDAGFSVPSPIHHPATETFNREVVSDAVDLILNSLHSPDVVGVVAENDDLESQVADEDGAISAIIEDEDVSGEIDDESGEVSATTDGEDTTGTVEDC